MNIVSLEDVSKSYGFKPLFEHVTFGIEDTDKIGIIGANGAGKTTLLRMIAGVEQPDTGRVVRTKGKSLAYLSQDPTFDGDLTVLQTIFASDSPVMNLIRDYEEVCHAVAAGNDDAATLERMSELQHQLDITGGWDIEANARAVLQKLNITDTSVKVGTLSGGQRKRVALAHELIFTPDILILDEPTASLDGDTGRSIMQFVKTEILNAHRCIVIVTHDARILDMASRILDMEDGKLSRIEHGEAR